jgi:hypothetical protein
METIEFEGKTLLINPGGDCLGCYFEKENHKFCSSFTFTKYDCIAGNCNFILKEDGKPV